MKVHSMALIGTVFLGLTPFQIPTALGQSAMEASDHVGASPMQAARLIGKDVVDRGGHRLGVIQSVIVGPNGKIAQVVLDIGTWLEADKRIAVAWSSLRTDAEGRIVSTLTKETAARAKKYTYLDPSLSGSVITADGKPYDPTATISAANP